MQLEIESFSYPRSELFLIPNPNAWDVSDIGTTVLGVQGTQLLLHEFNMASGPDFFVVGMPEYERQVGSN